MFQNSATLTNADKSNVRYQCRPGLLITVLLLVLGSSISLVAANIKGDKLNNSGFQIPWLWLLAVVFVALAIGFIMTHKYLIDLRRGTKDIVLKQIEQKIVRKDFEAGSGCVACGQEMNEFHRFDLVIDSEFHRVNRELFEMCSEGDWVEFHFASKSRFLLSIEKPREETT